MHGANATLTVKDASQAQHVTKQRVQMVKLGVVRRGQLEVHYRILFYNLNRMGQRVVELA